MAIHQLINIFNRLLFVKILVISPPTPGFLFGEYVITCYDLKFTFDMYKD